MVWQNTRVPLTKVPDEALRTGFKEKSQEEPAPQWLEVEDAMMEDRMSKDEAEWRVKEWLEESL